MRIDVTRGFGLNLLEEEKGQGRKAKLAATEISNLNINGLDQRAHSGFHLDPELASTSRAAGAPPAGGGGHIVTTIRHKPFSEFNNIILLLRII
jgi:hypothetical protein